VTYERYEFHSDENTLPTATLLTFVYEIPFDACGVFPPLHIANQIFSRGTAGGRLHEVDYLLTNFREVPAAGRKVQDNLRVSTGFRFRF
jgi:hypothetical protein